MIRRPPRSTRVRSSAASDVYKRQGPEGDVTGGPLPEHRRHPAEPDEPQKEDQGLGSAHGPAGRLDGGQSWRDPPFCAPTGGQPKREPPSSNSPDAESLADHGLEGKPHAPPPAPKVHIFPLPARLQ